MDVYPLLFEFLFFLNRASFKRQKNPDINIINNGIINNIKKHASMKRIDCKPLP